MTTDTVIDNLIDAIDNIEDTIIKIDEKPAKTEKGKKRQRDERLTLVRQLASLHKQLAGFGKRGEERRQFGEDMRYAIWVTILNIDPEPVAQARAFLERHDPASLAKQDVRHREPDFQAFRLQVIRLQYGDTPSVDEAFRRYLDSIRDADGNLPAWWNTWKRTGKPPEGPISDLL